MLTYRQFIIQEATRDHHETIRNLIKVADRPGTPEEGKTAMAHAVRLAAKHGISLSPFAPVKKKPAPKKKKTGEEYGKYGRGDHQDHPLHKTAEKHGYEYEGTLHKEVLNKDRKRSHVWTHVFRHPEGESVRFTHRPGKAGDVMYEHIRPHSTTGHTTGDSATGHEPSELDAHLTEYHSSKKHRKPDAW